MECGLEGVYTRFYIFPNDTHFLNAANALVDSV